MASGGIYYEFTHEDNLVRLSNRRLSFTVSGITTIEATGTYAFHVLRELGSADYDELAPEALVTVADGVMTKTNPSTLIVPLDVDDWPDAPGEYAFELWRIDTGNRDRISYGPFPVTP